MLKEKIYYADQNILEEIDTDFNLIERKGWYELYQNEKDKSYWRLDPNDKYQERFFVKLPTLENWTEFDDKDLRIELLLKERGKSDEICIWKNCKNNALNDLAYCEFHAYKQMNIKR